MSELWEKELDQSECECCEICGCAIQNGEAYYELDGVKLCENCMDDQYRRIMDYDDHYTREDYLTEEYERKRHDG